MDKKIMSIEGNFNLLPHIHTIVQYSMGEDFVAFCLSDMDLEEIKSNPELFFDQVKENKFPLWSELSNDMCDLIISSYFDMYFVENDDYWTEEISDSIWLESCKKGLDSVVTLGDDCLITVYCGAMCRVNWAGHPVYGKPCLEYEF